nr:hypothetical protein I308_02374 [Cryptococcus tetragattii IND107]
MFTLSNYRNFETSSFRKSLSLFWKRLFHNRLTIGSVKLRWMCS